MAGFTARKRAAQEVGPVEAELRSQLDGAHLLCEADVDEETLSTAEDLVIDEIKHGDIDDWANRFPALFAAFVAIRGAERYEPPTFWGPLGIDERQQRTIGELFLGALGQLGLRTFEEFHVKEAARRFVTPALLHGGLPAAAARDLVRQVSRLRDLGVTSGEEALARLLDDPLLDEELWRSTRRLLQADARFSTLLLRAVLARLGGDENGDEGLPHNVEVALDELQGRSSRGRRQNVKPWVEFDPWRMAGPVFVVPDNAAPCEVRIGQTILRLGPGEQADVPRPGNATCVLRHRLVELLVDEPVLWFAPGGHLVSRASELPTEVTAVVAANWYVRGEPVDPTPVEEPIPLSGAWSHYRAERLDLTNVRRVWVERGTEVGSPHLVARAPHASLAGEAVPYAIGPEQCRVFSRPPEIIAPGVPGKVVCVFDSVTGERRPLPILCQNGRVDLSPLFPAGAHAGWLTARVTGTERIDLPIAVVHGFGVDLSDPLIAAVPPQAISVRMDPSIVAEGTVPIIVPPDAETLPVPIPGLPAGTIRIRPPWVHWTFQSAQPSPTRLDSETAQMTEEQLLQPDLRLVVRGPEGGSVQVALVSGEKQLQSTPAVRLRADRTARGVGHAVVPLGRLSDTIRQRDRTKPLDVLAVVDRKSVVVARVAPSGMGGRAGSSAPAELTSHAGIRHEDLPREAPVKLAAGLRALSPPERVVTFAKGVRQLVQGERQNGAAAELLEAANKFWAYSEFRRKAVGTRDLTSAIRDRARYWQLELRTWEKDRRTRIGRWASSNAVPYAVLGGWKHLEVVRAAGRGSASRETLDEVFPSGLFHVLAVAGGDDTRVQALLDIAALAPTLASEWVCLALALALEQPLTQLPPGAAVGAADHARSLSVSEMGFTIDGRRLTLDRVAVPRAGRGLRLWSATPNARAELVFVPRTDGRHQEVHLPGDVGDTLLVEEVDLRAIRRSPQATAVRVHLAPVPRVKAPAKPPRELLGVSLARSRNTALAPLLHALAEGRSGVEEAEALFATPERGVEALLLAVQQLSREPGAWILTSTLGIAVLPFVSRFTRASQGVAAPSLRPHVSLIFPVLSARHAMDFVALGVPRGPFAPSIRSYTRRYAVGQNASVPETWSYAISDELGDVRDLLTTLGPDGTRARSGLGPSSALQRAYQDIVAATVHAAAIPPVQREGTRMLLRAFETHHRLTMHAVVAGLAVTHLMVAERVGLYESPTAVPGSTP